MGADDDLERAALRHFLAAQRDSVVAIVAGLTDDQLRLAVLPSGWTPLGMVEHLGRAERFWFQIVVTGQSRDLPWVPDSAGEDCPFVSGRSTADVFAIYRDQCELSDAVLASVPLDSPPVMTGLPDGLKSLATSVRSIALHMIEETARHAGHLDAARELIDGRTGLGPR